MREGLRVCGWEQLGKTGSDQEFVRRYSKASQCGQGSRASLPETSYFSVPQFPIWETKVLTIVTSYSYKS